jgi:hypothetical protein
METTLQFVAQWVEARTRFSNQLKTLRSENLSKHLGKSPNSVGFLIRHIGDVELLFSKNVFGNSENLPFLPVILEKSLSPPPVFPRW